jgi:DNA-binding winged helix-turn-helix (wHTH) protein
MPHVAFKFFLPIEVFAPLSDHAGVRRDRLGSYQIEWQQQDLENMLHRRLETFSRRSVSSLDAIADVDVAGRVDRQLASWAYGSPRRLLMLGDLLFCLHCEQDGGSQLLLTAQDLDRVPPRFQDRYEVLALSLDEDRQQVLVGGRPLGAALTEREFKLLRLLYRNLGTVQSKDDVYMAAYETTEGVSDEAIDSLVYRLRKKIEWYPQEPVYLITVRGQGYTLQHAI